MRDSGLSIYVNSRHQRAIGSTTLAAGPPFHKARAKVTVYPELMITMLSLVYWNLLLCLTRGQGSDGRGVRGGPGGKRVVHPTR